MKEKMLDFKGVFKHEYLRIIALIFIFTFALMPLISLVFNIGSADISHVLKEP